MRLAFTCFEPGRGALADLHGLVAAAVAQGHECRVLCPRGDQPQLPGARVQPLPVSGRARHKRHSTFVRGVGEVLAREPADGVIGFTPMPHLDVLFAYDACHQRSAGEKRGWGSRRGGAYRYFNACEQAVFAAGAGTRILFLSERQQAEYAACYGALAARSRVLPPGIAADRCAGADAAQRRRGLRHALEVAEGELVFLFAGTDFERQGLDRAIRALAAACDEQPHQKMRLLVAGAGRTRTFHHLARKLGIAAQVRFLGWRDDMADLLLGADALVHPARYEAGGRILLEALAAQLPVITTDTCGYAPRVVEARAGLVLRSPFEPEDLSRALLRMLDGFYRSQCRETGLTYLRLTDLHALVPVALAQLETWLAQLPER